MPRALPLLGLLGTPLLLASVFAVMFGLIEQVSPLAALAVVPIALWEFSLGVWLVKGFNKSAVTSLPLASVEPEIAAAA